MFLNDSPTLLNAYLSIYLFTYLFIYLDMEGWYLIMQVTLNIFKDLILVKTEMLLKTGIAPR